MDKQTHLNGQVALVTGGSKGLGFAYASALAHAGANVAITARSEPELFNAARNLQERNGKVFAYPADVSNPQAVSRLVQEVDRALGSIDLLINTAGVFQTFGVLAETNSQDWWREIEINLKGPFLVSRAVLPGMIARGRGRIINLVSTAGTIPLESVSAYSVSKTALIRLSEILALEAKPHNIGVFAIDPGTVRTPMTDQVVQSEQVKNNAPGVQEWFQYLFSQGQDTPVEQSVQLVLKIAVGQADDLCGCFLRAEDNIEGLIQRAGEIQEKDLFKLRLKES